MFMRAWIVLNPEKRNTYSVYAFRMVKEPWVKSVIGSGCLNCKCGSDTEMITVSLLSVLVIQKRAARKAKCTYNSSPTYIEIHSTGSGSRISHI